MSYPRRVHVIGAGLAGLAAAVRLAAAGVPVSIHEAAPQAGGRCRSYFDTNLGCRIDNGNHLIIMGNESTLSYVRAIGAEQELVAVPEEGFPFLDLESGERWVLKPNAGRVPWWLLDRRRRIPGSRARDYLGALGLAFAAPERTVADLFDRRTILYRRLWSPLTIAALNTAPETASAALLARVLRESFGRGGMACRPMLPRCGLSETLVDPAVRHLEASGTAVRLGSLLRALRLEGDRVAGLDLDGFDEVIGLEEAVVLAVPAPIAARLLPELRVPDAFSAIVNAHYRIRALPSAPAFIGLIGGVAEWVFRKDEVLSVTVSAADRLVDESAESLATALWRDVAAAYALPLEPRPAWKIVKEKRATFAATPQQAARRPGPTTRWKNLILAGDWTDTGLPSTIEGAIRSGHRAANLLLGK